MKHRSAPRKAESAVRQLARELQPMSLLADVQRVWQEAVGPVLAGHATPTAATNGVVSVTCESAVWAQELTLMAGELTGLLNARLGPGTVRELRCSAAPGRSWVRPA